MKKITKRIIAIILAVMVIVIGSMSAFALTACSNSKCGRIFESSSAYNVHAKVCEPSGTKKITYICSYCEAEFGKQILLSDHIGVCPMKPAIPQKGNANACKECSEIFDDENAYNNHIQLCREVFACKNCGKEFTTNVFKNTHQMVCPFFPPETEPSVEIKNNPGSKEIKFGDVLVLTVEAKNLPSGATVTWVADGGSVELEPSADGLSCKVKGTGDGKSTVFARAKNADGTPVRDTYGTEAYDTEVVDVDGNFFQKIISFFKDLFRMDRTVTN